MNLTNLLFLIIVGSFVAAASAYVGSIMVLRRMSLVGDALSHVALPGMAIALTFNISPLYGAFIALMLAVIGIWYLEKTSDTYPETIVGIFFTTSLAVGVLISKELDLLEALFGNIEKISFGEGVLTIIISIGVFIFMKYIIDKIMIMLISEEMAKTSGVKVNLINLLYLLIVGVVVSIGIRFVGTLLMGALVIVPAAASKNISKGMNKYFINSCIIGVVSAVFGTFVGVTYNLPAGPVIVLASVVIFILTYIKNLLGK
jgi:ABC-type Mn2+/Zn2+ transport system permease subunit